MTDNKQYPPLPKPDTHCFDEDTGQDVWSYSESQMRAYVDADRAMRALQAAPVAQGDALDQGVREELSIGKAINRAARDLPEGWEIRIDLERGAGVVHLTDPEGNETMIDGDGELFSDQINAAIDAARTQQEDKSGSNHDL